MAHKRTFAQSLKRFFINTNIGGVAVILPIALLIVVWQVIVSFISKLLSPMRDLIDLPDETKTWVIDLISLSIILTAFFFIGLVVRTQMGKNIYVQLEKAWLEPLPFYSTIRDIVQQFFGKKKTPLLRVVLVDVFGNDTLMTGFITEELYNGRYTVFVTTGPNPTNGFIFHVTASQLQFVDTKPEEAMRTIIGVGTGSNILFNGKKIPESETEGDSPE